MSRIPPSLLHLVEMFPSFFQEKANLQEKKVEGKFFVTVLESALVCLKSLARDRRYAYLESSIVMMGKMGKMGIELEFLVMLFRGLAYWEDLEHDWHLHFAMNVVIPKIGLLAKEFEADCRRIHGQRQSINWEGMICDFMEAIQQFKPHLIDICFVLSGGSFSCTSCPPNLNSFLEYGRDTATFVFVIWRNLTILMHSNFMPESVDELLFFIVKILEKFEAFVAPTNLSITEVKKLYELMSGARTWFNRISCIIYLYWVNQGKVGDFASSLEIVLSGLLHKPMPCNTIGVISHYFQPTTIPQLLAGYLDFLVLNLADPGVLHEGLIFLLSLIIDPPEDESEDGGLVRAQSCALINEFPSLVYSIPDEMKGGTCKELFSEFLLKIDTVKAKVTQLYLTNPYSLSQLNSPNTGAISFTKTVIGNLGSLLKCGNLGTLLKYEVCELLMTELVSLGPVVHNVTEVLQEDECEKIQNLRREIMNMIYNADYVIKFLHPVAFSVWYGIIALPNVMEHVTNVKSEIENIGADKIYKRKLEETWDMPISRGTTSEMNEYFIGFEKVASAIVDELKGGQKGLTIISISGLAGQGKTTLAKKVYNDRNIMYHFHKTVWCYVSKDCPAKQLLIQIIGNDHKGVNVKRMEMHDLADHLRKILKGRRYLIVLDDIWDVDAWHKLKLAFPDDKNGSRLLFTSRNHDLASRAEANSLSHHLRLFTNEESWELMKKMIFQSEVCPQEFVAVGNRIASYCKGLPLAVALISGVLSRMDKKLELWDDVAENLKSKLAHEGCTNVIELSYKNLPDHLKSCFLYFGAFPRGEDIRAKRLKLIWIAEGFVDESPDKSPEDLATGYLKDLVSQSLVVVTERSSMGGIKTCNVHDLLYDLCLEKAKEDNFLNWAEQSLVVDQCRASNFGSLHRLCVGIRTDPFIKSRPIVRNKKLPTGPLHSFLWSGSGEFSYSFLKNMKFLTILDLDINYSEDINDGLLVKCDDRFPDVILTMMHVRYLALRFLNYLTRIPPEIVNLRVLETLITGCLDDLPTEMPVSMWEMERLRHVCVKYFYADSSASSNVERLGTVHIVVSDSRTAEFLQNFPKLKKLDCTYQGHLFQLISMLASLTQLRSLNITMSPGLNSFEKNPSVNYSMIENLKKLSLFRLKAPWSVLSDIGKQLPNLEVLKIDWESFVGSVWKLEDGDFSKLRYLKLACLYIEEIDVSNCVDSLPFPCLEHLSVILCRKLVEIPSIFGEIQSLKTIQVVECSTEVEKSAWEIQEQQRDYGNTDLEVVILDKRAKYCMV